MDLQYCRKKGRSGGHVANSKNEEALPVRRSLYFKGRVRDRVGSQAIAETWDEESASHSEISEED